MHSKRKGSRVERELVKALQAAGVDALRVPLSGAVEGFKGDILLGDKVAEVKTRKNGEGFAVIERWLADNDYLFLKRDRNSPLVVMAWEEFLDLKCK